MAMTLTPGREMRLEGAPDQMLPHAEDTIQAVAAQLLAEDEDGTQFGGDIRKAIPVATQMVIDSDRGRMDAAVAAGTAAAANRSAQRQAARGVVPESLPPGEYGVASGRTVQEANRPAADAEAALMQEQDIADQIVRGYREGSRNWQAEGDRQYAQEYGLGGFDRGPGNTDLDYRRRLQEQRGFIRTQQGMIPVGPPITPEEIESLREFDEWASESPGSERQALYDPQGYETYREGVRQGIQDDAREDMATYGTGVSDPAVRADLGLPPLSPKQEADREARARSEDRVADAEREVRIARLARSAGVSRAEARAMMDAQRGAMQGDGPPLGPLTVAQRRQETQELRDRAGTRRDADLAARQAALRSQRMLNAPGGAGLVNAINQLPQEWRNIAILDRITQGRVGGPTPLGVAAVGAQNALRFLNNEAMAGMDPLRRQMMEAQLDMQLRQNSPAVAGQRDVAEGNFQTPEAVQHLDDLAERHDTTSGGFSYEDEMRLAQTLQKPPYNMSQADAEAKAYELAESRRWFSGGKPAGQQGVATPPAPAPQAQPPAPDVPIRRTPQGGGRGGPVRDPLPMLPGGAGRGGSRTLPRNRR